MTSSYIRELQNKSKIECLTSYSSPEKFVLASESNLVIFSLSFISSFMSSSKKTNERAIAVKSKNRNDSAQSVCLFFRPLYVRFHIPYSTSSENRIQMFSTTSSLSFMLLKKKKGKQMLCAMELQLIVYQTSFDNSYFLQSVILLVGLAHNANTYVTSQLPRILRLFLANI